MKYIDDENKLVKWYNCNLFYVCTIIIVLGNILAYVLGGKNWNLEYAYIRWTDFDLYNILVAFLSAFEHSTLQHCLLNCLCFFIAGTYLERKIGSFSLFVLVISLTFICECITDANTHGAGGHGFSGVNYAIYAYIIVDYVFMFIKKKQTRTNIIYGSIIIALICISFFFNGGSTKFSFTWYPSDLINNMGHYVSFIVGAVLSILIQSIELKTIYETKQDSR